MIGCMTGCMIGCIIECDVCTSLISAVHISPSLNQHRSHRQMTVVDGHGQRFEGIFSSSFLVRTLSESVHERRASKKVYKQGVCGLC